jgi:hypothetical protein
VHHEHLERARLCACCAQHDLVARLDRAAAAAAAVGVGVLAAALSAWRERAALRRRGLGDRPLAPRVGEARRAAVAAAAARRRRSLSRRLGRGRRCRGAAHLWQQQGARVHVKGDDAGGQAVEQPREVGGHRLRRRPRERSLLLLLLLLRGGRGRDGHGGRGGGGREGGKPAARGGRRGGRDLQAKAYQLLDSSPQTAPRQPPVYWAPSP